MKTIDFSIPQEKLDSLIRETKDGKNSDIGKLAVEIVKLYFSSIDAGVTFLPGKKGADITVISNAVETSYEVKGTQDPNISFVKLKVSSQACHDALVNGMELIRVTNIRGNYIKLHFLKHGVDFLLVPEPRWRMKKIKTSK